MHPQAQKIKDALRVLLKQRGKTYQDLAVHLQVSHATIKRILTKEDLSLTRLTEICEWLSITFSDLEQLADRESRKNLLFFTEEQELFFLSDSRYFSYLHNLYEGKNPEEIARRYELDKRSTDKYLRRLEQMDLIRVTGKGQVKTKHAAEPHWRNQGPLAQANFKRIYESVSNYFAQRPLFAPTKDAENGLPSSGTIAIAGMSRETYKKFAKELSELLQKWEKVGEFEKKFDPAAGKTIIFNFSTWTDDLDIEAKLFGTFFSAVEPLE